MGNIIYIIFSAEFLHDVLRVTTPILFATMAATVASRSGIFNIALEGIMLIAALVGVIFSGMFQSSWIGFLFALFSGGFIGFMLGALVIRLKTDAILAGVAINLMASGGTVFALYSIAGDKGPSSSIPSINLPRVPIGFIEDVPIIGTIFSEQNIITHFALLSVVVIFILLYKTPLGLKIRAVGENPNAAESVGINVYKIQYIAVIISGILAAMGGAFLSMGYTPRFTPNMTAGRGFIGLAASAMGGATPVGGFLVSLLFGTADSMANTFQTGLDLPYELVLMFPYIVTIAGLSIFSYHKMKKAERLKNK